MKVVFHKDFHHSYTSDPAAATGRIEAVLKVIKDRVDFVQAVPAAEEDIAAVHTKYHIAEVTRERLYDIAALAAGRRGPQLFVATGKPAVQAANDNAR